MKKHMLPCYYYPTTIIAVDDDTRFLETIKLSLDNHFIIKTFSQPQAAVDYLNQRKQPAFSKQVCHYDEESTHPNLHVTINTHTIWQQIYDAKRFSQISVGIIDYTMPGLDGLELCQHVGHLPLQRILLTGEADEHLAVKAFNKGWLEQFIQKNHESLAETLIATINELQRNYFCYQSQFILESIDEQLSELLYEPTFIAFFQSFCLSHSIIEYYLWSESKTWLLATHDGPQGWLVLKEENELLFYETQAHDEKISKTMLDSLRQRKKIPCFLSPDHHQLVAPDWGTLLFPANKLMIGDKIYYYAYVPLSQELITFDRTIISHATYLQKQ